MQTFVDAPDEDVPGQTGYGLGVRRIAVDGRELVGLTGIFPGYSSVSLYSPECGCAVAVLSNLSVVEVVPVIGQLQAVLADR